MKAKTQSGCYAHPLNNCAGKISREHYFSESIYKMLAGKDGLIVDEAPWLAPGKSIKVLPKALAANVLCQHHNSILSDLDVEALRFFSLFRYETPVTIDKIDGPMLERWYLKALLGQMAAYNSGWVAPIEWLSVLFGESPFPENTGLMFPIGGKKLRGFYGGVEMQLYFSDPHLKVPSGLWMKVGWIASYLILNPDEGPTDFNFSFHPRAVSVIYPDKRKLALFPWHGLVAGFNGSIPNDPK